MVAAALAATFVTLAAGGCGGETDDGLIAKVQVVARQTCGFIPTAAMVAPILDSIGGTGGAATAAVAAGKVVCDIVTQEKVKTFFGWGERDGGKVEGCWVSNLRCQPDGTLKEDPHDPG